MMEQFAIDEAIRYGDLTFIKQSLEKNRNHLNLNQLFVNSIKFNQFEVVKYFLENENISPEYDKNLGLIFAIINNDLKTIELLIKDKRIKPEEYNNRAMLFLLEKKYINWKIVDILWNKSIETKLKENNPKEYKLVKTNINAINF